MNVLTLLPCQHVRMFMVSGPSRCFKTLEIERVRHTGNTAQLGAMWGVAMCDFSVIVCKATTAKISSKIPVGRLMPSYSLPSLTWRLGIDGQ